jgi:hypothetical protein
MPVGDVLEAVFYVTMQQQTSLNVRHYGITSVTPPEPSHEAVADRLHELAETTYPPLLTALAEFRGVTVRRISPGPPTPPFPSTRVAVMGEIPEDPLPKQVAGIITLRTFATGSAGRGRVYVPFPAESDNTATGVPQTTYIIRGIALASVFIGPHTVTAGGGSLVITGVIFHRGGGPATEIIGQTVQRRWGTQRRRGDYGASNVSPV